MMPTNDDQAGAAALKPPVDPDMLMAKLARGMPLPEVLAAVLRTLEREAPDLLVALYLLEGSPPKSVLVAAPRLSPIVAAYFASGAQGGLPAGFAAACEPGVNLLEAPLVEDLAWHSLAQTHSLPRSWMLAVRAYDGRPLGLLVLHGRQPSELSQVLRDRVRWASQLAALAILRHLAELDRVALRANLTQERIESDALSLELQQAARAREEFLCIAAHELRTPLAALMLQADSAARMLRRESLDPNRLRTKVGDIQTQVDRLKHLVEDLLDQSQAVEGNLKLDIARVDLVNVTQQAAAQVADAYRRAHCELRVRLAGQVEGDWDGLRLAQVVHHLLVNALKYGRSKPVDVWVQGTPDSGILVVTDRGMGIASSAQRRIFQRFGRAVSETHFGGFGNSLWMSKMIIDALGGSITVQSEIDAGAIFTVVLPRQRRRYFAPLAIDP